MHQKTTTQKNCFDASTHPDQKQPRALRLDAEPLEERIAPTLFLYVAADREVASDDGASGTVFKVRDAAARMECSNNLKQIGIAR